MSIHTCSQTGSYKHTNLSKKSETRGFALAEKVFRAPDVKLLAQSILSKMHSNLDEAVIDEACSDLFVLFFTSQEADLLKVKDELTKNFILTQENLLLRKHVRSAMSQGLYATLPPLAQLLVSKGCFAESLAVAKTMPTGAEKDLVLRHIAQGLAYHGRLIESIQRIKEIANLRFCWNTVHAVGSILADANRIDAAANLLGSLPDEAQSEGLRFVSMRLARQGSIDEANNLASKIPIKNVRDAALLDIFDERHSSLQCFKLSYGGFVQCCRAIKGLFRELYSS